MAQNIYDDPEFFAVFRQLRASAEKKGIMGGSMTAEELVAILPSLHEASVLDLGCGDGWFSQLAMSQGASSTHGFDLSKSQIELAKQVNESEPGAENMKFEVANLDSVELDSLKYDFAFSSLAVHYLQDLPGMFSKIHASLKPGGHFFFSTEHPIYTAPTRRETCSNLDGTAHWAFKDYWDEGERCHHWLGHDVDKNHWTVDTYVNAVLRAGFELVYFHEWERPGDGKFDGSSWWMADNIGPTFLMLGGRKKLS